MGSISVACYRPRPGCEKALLELVRNHLPPLRAQGLVTERTSIVARCGWNDRRDLRVGVAGSDCRRPPQSGSARFMEPVREGMHVRDSVELAGVPAGVPMQTGCSDGAAAEQALRGVVGNCPTIEGPRCIPARVDGVEGEDGKTATR